MCTGILGWKERLRSLKVNPGKAAQKSAPEWEQLT